MRIRMLLIGAGAAMAAPAHSVVTANGDTGFAVENSAEVRAAPDVVYGLLGKPARWWNGEHSVSGDASNLRLDPRPGGCFCEIVTGADGKAGGIEHARVIYAMPAKQLRLSGALGPLQAEAVTGTLTFTLEPTRGGTKVRLEYIVGGFMRMTPAVIAPAVDKVLGDQLARLKRAAEA